MNATSLVTLITPIKLNTISVQHVEFMHSIDLAVILRLMAFHYIVWMEELYKKIDTVVINALDWENWEKYLMEHPDASNYTDNVQ